MEKECLNCKRAFEISPGVKPKLYCSPQCRQKYSYAKRSGRPIPIERISECEYCSVEFDNWNNPNRKYCCHEHYVAVRYGKAPVNLESVENNRFGREERTRQKSVKSISTSRIKPPITPKPPAIIEAELPEIKVHELPQTLEMHRIFLILGISKFTGKFDSFAAKIPQTLTTNILDGDVFVFCNKSRYQLSVLQWQGDGFTMMFRRTESERYPWPFSPQPKAVEITREDLEMLLEYPRFTRRLRGLATPELLL